MSEDEELRKLAEQDLEKLDLVLSDLIGDASRLLIPGRDFDSSNAQLEVHAGEILFRQFSFKSWFNISHVVIQRRKN